MAATGVASQQQLNRLIFNSADVAVPLFTWFNYAAIIPLPSKRNYLEHPAVLMQDTVDVGWVE